MEYEMQRPHTVGAVPKAYARSEAIIKLLQQIHEEAKGPVERPKPPQKNYLKENLKRLKEIQARSKEKIAEKQPLQPLKVPNKYCQTQSKIFSDELSQKERTLKTNKCLQPPKTAGPFRSRPPCSPCFSSKSEEHGNLKHYRSLPRLNQTEETDQAPDLFEKEYKTQTLGSQHYKSTNTAKLKKESECKSEARHRLGQIPNYLTERKKQWELEREKQLKLIEEASVPSGYTLLPDEERVETLELLKKNHEELIRSLAMLPVRNDTIRLRNYTEELQRQLAKVEEGIKIFSRPKVLIKNDA